MAVNQGLKLALQGTVCSVWPHSGRGVLEALFCGPRLKPLSNLLYFCFCSVSFVLFFGLTAYGILASGPGMEPAPPALEGEALTPGPPAKNSLHRASQHLELLGTTCELPGTTVLTFLLSSRTS